MTLSGETQDEGHDVLQQVVSIVSAYVSHNAMRATELPEFIGAVHASMTRLAKEPAAAESKPAETPAVPVKRSISREFIICLECGKKFKSLRRHLSSFHGLTPDEYRAKWSLPSDYPMVAPAYSATRSQLARDSGLGQLGRNAEGAGTGHDAVAEADDDMIADIVDPGEAVESAETDGEGAAAEEAAVGKATARTRRASKTVEKTAEPADEPAAAEETGDEPTPAAAVETVVEHGAKPDHAADGSEAPKKAKRGRPRKVAA